jgi:hypothetical protein
MNLMSVISKNPKALKEGKVLNGDKTNLNGARKPAGGEEFNAELMGLLQQVKANLGQVPNKGKKAEKALPENSQAILQKKSNKQLLPDAPIKEANAKAKMKLAPMAEVPLPEQMVVPSKVEGHSAQPALSKQTNRKSIFIDRNPASASKMPPLTPELIKGKVAKKEKSIFMGRDQLKERFLNDHVRNNPKSMAPQASKEPLEPSIMIKAGEEVRKEQTKPFISPYTMKTLIRQSMNEKRPEAMNQGVRSYQQGVELPEMAPAIRMKQQPAIKERLASPSQEIQLSSLTEAGPRQEKKVKEAPLSFAQFQTQSLKGRPEVAHTHQSKPTQTLNLNGVQPDEVIQKVTNYIETSRLRNQQEVQLNVVHDKIGEFKLKVNQAPEGVHIEVVSKASEAKEFFKENQFKIINNLMHQGVKVSNFKIDFSQSRFENQQFDQGSSQSYQHKSSSQQFSQSEGGERRKEMWEMLRERMAA